VVDTDFAGDLNADRLTFNIYDVSNPQNANLVKKYNTVGSQLFLDEHRGNIETIVNAGNLWDWNCTRDRAGFGLKIQSIIEKALNGRL
jgi:hypothetical protein